MSVKPIIFSGPMVKALLAGTKTQTRRALTCVPEMPEANCHPRHKPKHRAPYLDAYCSRRPSPDNPRGMSNDWCWWQVDDRQCLPTFKVSYAPGDLLYVREAWRAWADHDALPPRDIPAGADVQYLADDPASPWDSRYRHARFMPRWASRITLEVSEVRVQRLQDISAEDAIAEGIDRWMTVGEARAAGGLAWGAIPDLAPHHSMFWIADYDQKLAEDADRAVTLDPREAYRALWNSIHGEGAWDRNDWIAAYTFTVRPGNVDDLLKARGPI